MAAGNELKRLRLSVNKSANSFAELIGVRVDRYRKWEEKDMNPREEDAEAIKAFFEIENLSELEHISNVPKKSKNKKEVEQTRWDGEKTVIDKDYLELLKKTIAERDILLAERDNRIKEMSIRIDSLLKINSDLKLKVQKNLETLTKDQATSNYIQEAFHEKIVELILLSRPDIKAGSLDDLIRGVYKSGLDKQLAESRKGNY